MSDFKQRSDKTVAVFLATGFEEVEAIAVVDVCFRAGIRCDMVSVTAEDHVTSSRNVTVVADRTIVDEGFSFDDYDMLVLPGGIPGMPNLKACEPLCQALVARAADGRDMAAICASPSILAELGILEGRTATANPHFQQVLAEKGAEVLPATRTVVDGNVITSQGMGTAVDFGLAIVEHYLGLAAADRVRQGLVLLD